MRVQRAARLLAIVAGTLACIATSIQGPRETALRGPFLINWTKGRVVATVTVRAIPCDATDASGYGPPIEQRYALYPAEMVSLGEQLALPDAGGAVCGLAEARVGEASARATWGPDVGEVIVREVMDGSGYTPEYTTAWAIHHSDDWAFERAIVIHGLVRAPVLELGELLRREERP